MAQTVRMKTAGGLVYMSVAPRVNRTDGYTTRREKRRIASNAQRSINGKAAYLNLEFSLAANVQPGDLVLTMTYSDAFLPHCWSDADRAAKAFIRRVRARLPPGSLLYYYNIERAHYSERPAECHRYHHHMIIRCGLPPDELQNLWPYGHVNHHLFALDAERTYGSMAKYLIKERSEFPGKRAWRCSRGLRKPETDSWIVPDDYVLPVPARSPSCMILENDGPRLTEYGRFQTLKFQTDDLTSLPHPRKVKRE